MDCGWRCVSPCQGVKVVSNNMGLYYSSPCAWYGSLHIWYDGLWLLIFRHYPTSIHVSSTSAAKCSSSFYLLPFKVCMWCVGPLMIHYNHKYFSEWCILVKEVQLTRCLCKDSRQRCRNCVKVWQEALIRCLFDSSLCHVSISLHSTLTEIGSRVSIAFLFLVLCRVSVCAYVCICL